ncbi:pituitary tumor-transforming gene 1 protein-interacting protein-like [Megalops cyprinoides]|uniref:pituitary tumor-transforming gene 1 protein-interacting protein-like n=1 Tax=Megalops cyprinoides TaxID=118141 RepID=UPI0018651725|nr:pituitary tumor-transforming gene 1 protein-interacting protein-like [Megalops cyprinoides]
MGNFRIFIFVLVVIFSLTTVFAQTSAPGTVCAAKSNTTCEDCLSNVSCLWCGTTKRCIDYPVRTILPPHSLCPLAEARWGVCWVNFQALIIAMSVIAGIIIIAILVCCFCCCKCEKIGAKRTTEKMDQEAEKRKVRQEERRAEMKMRHDEIRQKYGLTKENPYARFENN